MGGLTLVTLLTSRVPLLNSLSYEFTLLMAFLTALAAGYTTIALQQVLQEKKNLSAFFLALRFNCLYPLLPLLLVLMLSKEYCGIWEGLAFYLLLPFLSVLYATGWGRVWSQIFPRPLHAGIAFLLFFFLSVTWSVLQILQHPPLFAFNHFFGYFAGPIYDEVVSIRPALLIYRSVTILHVGILLCLLTICESPVKGVWSKIRSRRLAMLFLTCSLVVLSLLYIYQGELGMFTTRSYLQKVLGGRYETPHFRLFYPLHSPVEREIEQIALDHEFRYAQLVRFLQITPTQKLTSYIYVSPEQKKALMGAGRTMFADPFNLEMHLNYQPFPHPVLKHELTHLLSTFFAHPFLKINLNMGLVEGIAEAATWESEELTPHQWSKAMLELGIAPSVTSILRPWSFWLELPSRSYMLMGSFIRYLIEAYGIDRFKRIYRGESFEQVYGKGIDQLTTEWQQSLQGIPLSVGDQALAKAYFDVPALIQRSCGHEVARLKMLGWKAYSRENFGKAREYFATAQRWNPGEPESQRGLLASWYAEKKVDEALALSETMLGNRATLFQQLYARNIRGDLFWEAGDLERAREEFLWISTHTPTSVYKRLAAIKLAALKLAGSEKIRLALAPHIKKGEALSQLRKFMALNPTFAPAHYLLGRRLLEKGFYREATDSFHQAERFGLAEESLQLENHRLLGIALYHQGKYDEAQEYFQQVRENTLSAGIRNEALEWIERCQWEKERKDKAG